MTVTWQSVCFILAIVVGVLAMLVGWGVISSDSDFFAWQGLFSLSWVLYLVSRYNLARP